MKFLRYLFLLFNFSCSQKILVKSYPSGAEVKVIDLSGDIEKPIGATPVNLKIEKNFGSMFYIEIEKDKYRTKKLLISAVDGTNLKIDTKLEVLEDYNERLKQAVNNVSNQQKAIKDTFDKEKLIDETFENKQNLINRIEIELSLYKAMMFDKKYSKGIANFDKNKLENIIDIVSKAKEEELKNNYKQAINFIYNALELDSNNIYLNSYLSKLYILNKEENEANKIQEKIKNLSVVTVK